MTKDKGGSDNVKNIAGLCDFCHNSKFGVHKNSDAYDQLSAIKEGLIQKYKVSLLNSIMPRLIEEMSAFCEKKGIKFSLTDGKTTKKYRDKFSIPKKHCTDGFVISLADRNLNEIRLDGSMVYIQQRFKKKSAANISKLNQREYYADMNGKQVLVAKNRHKAEGQKENSLEEYMDKYSESHSPEECMEHLKNLVVHPAKRTYFSHRKGKWSSIHAGDVVIYEKYNKAKGNTKRLVFVATVVKIAGDCIVSDSAAKRIRYCRTLSSSCTPYIIKAAL